jgi:hypothetical protein
MDEPNCALTLAAAELRHIAQLDFLLDENSGEGLLLSQLAFDLRLLAGGAPLRSTCLWLTFAAQWPELFLVYPVSRNRRCEVHDD